jgi:hypothetical protein
MAATATSFGDGRFGIGADQTGFIIESISQSYASSNKMVKDRTGNTSGITYYDEQVKVSLKGKVPKTSPFSGTIASSLTLANPLSSYLKGGTSGGLAIVETITLDYGIEEYAGISLDVVFYPNITA